MLQMKSRDAQVRFIVTIIQMVQNQLLYLVSHDHHIKRVILLIAYKIADVFIHIYIKEKILLTDTFSNFICKSASGINVKVCLEPPDIPPQNLCGFKDSRNRIYFAEAETWRFSGSFYGKVETSDYYTGCAVYKNGRNSMESNSCLLSQIRLYLKRESRTDVSVEDGVITDSRLFDALGLDYIMSHNHRVILHSSFISRQGEGILFTAPSGTGKSTQADLWKRHEEGVTIINGDRSILGFKEGRAWVYGLPFCGTSGIAENMDCPLRAVVVLRQGRENQIRRLGQREAFSLLLSECTVNTWDTEGTENIMDLLIRIVRTVPVYYFACLPDFSAVEMLKAALADDYRKG